MLSPTRELAAQTERNILALGEFLKVQAHCCIGGKSLGAPQNLVNSHHIYPCTTFRSNSHDLAKVLPPGEAGIACHHSALPQLGRQLSLPVAVGP